MHTVPKHVLSNFQFPKKKKNSIGENVYTRPSLSRKQLLRNYYSLPEKHVGQSFPFEKLKVEISHAQSKSWHVNFKNKCLIDFSIN